MSSAMNTLSLECCCFPSDRKCITWSVSFFSIHEIQCSVEETMKNAENTTQTSDEYASVVHNTMCLYPCRLIEWFFSLMCYGLEMMNNSESEIFSLVFQPFLLKPTISKFNQRSPPPQFRVSLSSRMLFRRSPPTFRDNPFLHGNHPETVSDRRLHGSPSRPLPSTTTDCYHPMGTKRRRRRLRQF